MNKGWNNLMDAAVRMRRHLHQRPELAWQETETAAFVRRELEDAGIPWHACARTGTVGILAPRAPGRSIALRADMDALPLTEATGLPWTSGHPGRMHACGHDGHLAALLAAARWLKGNEEALPGPVTLVFQPAEEGGHGARRMIDDGALDGVQAIYGWHNWPAIPFGQAVCPDGPVLCANGTFAITLRGAGGHASQPELCRDPVLAAAAVTLALQQIVSRRMRPQDSAVVSVTTLEAGGAPTITPGEARVGGSIRVGNTADRDRLFEHIRTISAATAAGYGVAAEVAVERRYDATVNHAGEAARYRSVLAGELGEAWQPAGQPVPLMASEDFSEYLKRIPGAFALLGSGLGQGDDAPCHSPHYDFNDRLLPLAVRILAQLAGAPVPHAEAEGEEAVTRSGGTR